MDDILIVRIQGNKIIKFDNIKKNELTKNYKPRTTKHHLLFILLKLEVQFPLPMEELKTRDSRLYRNLTYGLLVTLKIRVDKSVGNMISDELHSNMNFIHISKNEKEIQSKKKKLCKELTKI